MTLLEGEPAAGPWRALDTAELVNHVLQVAGQPLGRPQIVAVDGRGASGKSTLAAELKRAVARSAVVHTDGLAWHEPFFAWGHLLRDEILVTPRVELVQHDSIPKSEGKAVRVVDLRENK